MLRMPPAVEAVIASLENSAMSQGELQPQPDVSSRSSVFSLPSSGPNAQSSVFGPPSSEPKRRSSVLGPLSSGQGPMLHAPRSTPDAMSHAHRYRDSVSA
jgi:hypothetical protein